MREATNNYPSGIAVDRREIKTLDMKPFKVIQQASTEVALTHAVLTANEQSRAEDP
jgi:hypothetical protein